MARQDGTVLLTGPIGDLSFYKTAEGYFARKKSGVSAERIKSDPAYARTRENTVEFGRASRATKLFRRAFHSVIQTAADNRITGRLTSAMLKIIKSDAIHSPGQRTAVNGKALFLQGFEFNNKRALASTFNAVFTASIDACTGRMTINVPSFNPRKRMKATTSATHFRLTACGAVLDFANEQCTVLSSQTVGLPFNRMVEPLQLTVQLPVSGDHMFLAFGVEFLHIINGRTKGCSEAVNAMAIVSVCPGNEDRLDAMRVTQPEKKATVPAKIRASDLQRFVWRSIHEVEREKGEVLLENVVGGSRFRDCIDIRAG